LASRRGLQNEDNSILKIRTRIIAVVALATFCLHAASRLKAQSNGSSPLLATRKLTEQESRGEGFFLQRCSLCHLPRKLKFGSPPVIGPSLSGQFKDADSEQLKVLRGFILKGGPDMPGFQYGLEPKEVDDLIAYLKTL
jgi:mono/diheme cytochrome c family protein